MILKKIKNNVLYFYTFLQIKYQYCLLSNIFVQNTLYTRSAQ
ncbi:hypothetical protein HMPREF9445_03057 [Bacteroides clarus YIT 12056]|uniref:Uncharacterized protein n=1 Tax=Bacteroides clarus YIT 12056 TaxID=762984 RepID=A0ABN0CK53_9BACE|nr:hypothetical protein HMPREF9445_03057 [Bacteroides clarus YIT 12056]